jgi:mannose-6-phosphate isomerase-like protein (cupin superfamily)
VVLTSGRMAFRCGEESFSVRDHGFVFVPRGTMHTYTIESVEARLIGMSTPSSFGDNIERTGRRL